MTCLGCGGITCQVCEDKSNALTTLSHWPLEVSVSRAALIAVEEGIRMVLPRGYPNTSPELDAELNNLANIIRAHLQHAPAPTVSTDEDWLA